MSAEDLMQPDVVIESDVIVCADDEEAKRRVMELAETIEAVRAG